MALINGMAGNFFTIVYLPNDAEFKWGTYPQQWLGLADFKTIDDQAGADVSDNGSKSELISSQQVQYIIGCVGRHIQYKSCSIFVECRIAIHIFLT